MFRQPIYDNPHVKVKFETVHPVLFSILHDGAFEKKWKPWRPRYFALREDSKLIYRKNKQSPIKGILDLNGTRITQVVLEDTSNNPLISKEYGINVTCKRDGIDTSFRCILNERDLQGFYDAIRSVISNHHIDDALTNLRHSTNNRKSQITTQSVMRSAITKAMDKYDKSANKINIMKRRGAMKFLPVHRANDLVHGSWWFVVGSVLMVVTSCIVLANDFNPVMGEDDSTLTDFHYRGSWVLMVISGVFFTLGSLAFVRAVHESPPMKPLFSWYHLSSDELLGSWLFLFACLPFIPYALIYMSEADPPHKPIYVGALVAIGFIILGCFMFVLACYPSQSENDKQYFLPMLHKLLWCCCSFEWIEFHMANDWLAGCWFIFLGSLVATVAAFALTIYSLADWQSVQVFIFSTTFIENFIFLVGSAYFVAGSYPESEGGNGDEDGVSTGAGDSLNDPLMRLERAASGNISLVDAVSSAVVSVNRNDIGQGEEEDDEDEDEDDVVI